MAKRSGSAPFADAKHGKKIICHVIPNFHTIFRTANKRIHHFLRRLKLIEKTLAEAIFSVVPDELFFPLGMVSRENPVLCSVFVFQLLCAYAMQ